LTRAKANRAKDEFLMTLSHELRTPMTAILGWARLLPTLPTSGTAFREGVAAIGRSAQLQAKLIDDVLDVSAHRLRQAAADHRYGRCRSGAAGRRGNGEAER